MPLPPSKPLYRFLLGLSLTLLVLILGFAWVAALIPAWGAQPDEVALSLPGDEVVPQPQILWDHAITIQAPAAQVYPWLIQIGDTRGAFYSYVLSRTWPCARPGWPGVTSMPMKSTPSGRTPRLGRG